MPKPQRKTNAQRRAERYRRLGFDPSQAYRNFKKRLAEIEAQWDRDGFVANRDEIIVTEELIESVKSIRGGFDKEGLAYLGVEWPPKKGWKRAIVGRPLRPLKNAQRPLAEQTILPGDD